MRKKPDMRKLIALVNHRIAESPGAVADDPDDMVTLLISEPATHNGERVKVFRTYGPYARVVSGVGGRLTVRVSARRLRDWLVKWKLWEADGLKNERHA